MSYKKLIILASRLKFKKTPDAPESILLRGFHKKIEPIQPRGLSSRGSAFDFGPSTTYNTGTSVEGEQFGIELKISAHLPFLWHDEAITFNLTITNRQTIDGQTDALADARKGHTLFRESRMRKMEKKR